MRTCKHFLLICRRFFVLQFANCTPVPSCVISLTDGARWFINVCRTFSKHSPLYFESTLTRYNYFSLLLLTRYGAIFYWDYWGSVRRIQYLICWPWLGACVCLCYLNLPLLSLEISKDENALHRPHITHLILFL